MNWDQIIPAIFMIAVLILVLPSFLRTNSKLKLFLTNLSIWAIIVSVVMIVLYFIFWMKKINLAITGCMGRMGQQFIRSAKSDKNFKLVSPKKSLQVKSVNKAIKYVKLGKVREAEKVIKPAINYLKKIKCKKIILGCTELPIAIFAYKSLKKIKESKIFIDPNLILAEVCKSKYKSI